MPSGEVLFYKVGGSEDRGFGYIVPDDGDGDRESNVWFGSRALSGSFRPTRGDRVRYQLDDGANRPAADFVQLLENLITTLEGED
jgi:cold shock CspA family protein